MDAEVRGLIDEIGREYKQMNEALEQRAEAAAKAAVGKRIDSLESRIDTLATFGGADGARTESKAFRMPSLMEWRAMSANPETKAMAIGSDPGGGYIVMPEAGGFHDRMRPANVILQADPVVVDMETLELILPKLTDSSTVYPKGEGATLTESDLTLGQVRLAARKYTVRTIVSSELLADSNPGARQIIADDHARQLGNRLDLDMLEGNSTSIIGLRRKPGVNVTTIGSGNGENPDLDDVADALYRLEAANADLSRVRLVMHPRTWNVLRKQKDSGGDGRFLLTPNPTQDATRKLFGVPVLTSPQVSITETVGGSTDCSYILAVDFSRVVVGRRNELGVLFDPYSKSSTDQIVIQSQVRYDLALLHAAACEVIAGVRAT